MNSIQKKIWVLALAVLLIMVAIWVSLTYYNQKMQTQYNDILKRYLMMNEVTTKSQQTITALNNYLLEPSTANLERLNVYKEKIQNTKEEVTKFRHADNDFALTNYENLINSLVETADQSVMLRTEEETGDYLRTFSEASRISKYISEMSLTLIDTELKTYDRLYRSIIDRSEEIKKLGVLLLCLVTLLLLFFTYWFSSRITRPIKTLTEAASELSKGRFDLKISVDSNDEIAFLAKTFDKMRINLNNFLSEVQQKAQLESELQQNKLLLQESQLQSLQSQINPHFLYNTLDTLSKKAYLEGSAETSDLLVSVARLLRYNLNRMDKSTTLSKEVKVLQQYMDIQKARFTHRLHFHIEIDESCLDIQIPRLTLQPIVENAVIHAIEPEEDGGHIWFRAYENDHQVLIEIEDHGPSIPKHIVERIIKGDGNGTTGHSTGIGIHNVVNRLRLFYDYEDVIEIDSTEGKGTKVILKIPKTRRIQSDDEIVSR